MLSELLFIMYQVFLNSVLFVVYVLVHCMCCSDINCFWSSSFHTFHFSEMFQVLFSNKLECGLMPNVMATQLNIGGAVCESSIIPFLVHVQCRKVWLTPTAGVQCSNAANTGECMTWTWSEFCTGQNLSGGKSPKMYIFTVYQPRRWPNIVQSLGGLRWVTSLEEWNLDAKPIEICWGAPNCGTNLSR